MSTKTRDPLGSIDEFLSRIESGNRQKFAESRTEAGGYTGSSSHPVAKAEDGTRDAPEGARSSENEKDNKAEQPIGVGNTTAGTPGGQDSVMPNIGVRQSASGEDPSVEDDYKSTKDDPGTSHPAKTDDGEKYSSDNFRALIKRANDLGGSICTGVHQLVSHGLNVKAAAGVQQPAADPAQAIRAGQAAADLAAQDQLDKQALDQLVVESSYNALCNGATLAIKVASFLDRVKRAEGEDEAAMAAAQQQQAGGAPPEDPNQAAPEEGAGPEQGLGAMMGGGEDQGGGGGEGQGGEGGMNLSPEEEHAILQALLGGEHIDAGGAMSEMGAEQGGMPQEGGGGMPGGDMQGGGGMPGGEMQGGGEGGGEGSPEDAAMLQQILSQMHQTPEGMEVAAGAVLPERFKQQIKSAAAAGRKFQPKNANERQRFAQMQGYVKEIFERSQA